MACLFMSGSDNTRYQQLKRDLQNDHLKGNDSYPKSYEEARKMLENYKPYGAKNTYNRNQNDKGGWHSSKKEKRKQSHHTTTTTNTSHQPSQRSQKSQQSHQTHHRRNRMGDVFTVGQTIIGYRNARNCQTTNNKRQQLMAQVAEMDDDEEEESEDCDGVAFFETSSKKRQTLNPNYAYLDT